MVSRKNDTTDFVFPEADGESVDLAKTDLAMTEALAETLFDGNRVSRRTTLKGLLGSAAAVSLGTSITAAETTDSDEFTRIDRVEIESFDGTTIVGSLYEPTTTGPHPSMLITHGWGADRNAAYVHRLAEMYAANDYVVLTYDSRGFGESGGEVGVDGPKEVEDAQTLISWLANRGNVQTEKNDPNNPRIGMDSLSYAGGIQLNTAAVDNRLDAIVPRWAWHDLVYSLGPNGVIKSGWGGLLYAVGNTGSRGLTSGDNTPDEHDARYGLDDGVHRAFLGSTATNEFSQNVKSFYKVRSPVTKLDQLANNDTPTLLVSGWNDTLFVPNEALWNFEGLRERGVNARLLLFQGGHTFGETATNEVREFIDQQALEFSETHVREPGGGKNSSKSGSVPVVTYYDVREDDGVSSFKTTTDVPPPGGDTYTIDLAAGADGQTTTVANTVAPTSTSQIAPTNEDYAEGASAVTFDFVVEETTEVFGSPEPNIQVESLGGETTLFLKVSHVDREGDETLINDQVAATEFAGAPGEVRTLPLDEMIAFQWTFEPGETLRLTAATTDAGFYSSRESTGARIHHAPDQSTVTFPVIYDMK